jgi:hypothetical protein
VEAALSPLVVPRGNAADSRHLAMVKEQITNTGIIPAMTSADDGFNSQEGREEVLGLRVNVVSISGAKGKRLLEVQQWKNRPYRQAPAERSAIESLVFTLKEGFEFGEMARRSHENVLAEMLEILSNVVYRGRGRILVEMNQAACWDCSSPSTNRTPVTSFGISSNPWRRRQCFGPPDRV